MVLPQPMISTVLLCWNRCYLTRKCLESYLDTVTVPYELMIVNNASSDETKEWLDSREDDSRISEIIHREENNPAAALNEALMKCSGRYLHVMENDHLYLRGWDRYVVERFEKISELGQLGVSRGPRPLLGELCAGSVFLSLGNVGCSSYFRRELFFDRRIKFVNHYRGNSYPDDVDFSQKIREAGALIAWPDRKLAVNLGHSEEEFQNNPDYYIRDYHLKLFSYEKWRGLLSDLLRLDFRKTWFLRRQIARLLKLYVYRLRAIRQKRP